MPGDGDVGVDGEGAGEDGGGDLGGELEQRGAAVLAGTDPEVVEPPGQRAVLMGRPGWPPGNSQGEGVRAPMVAWPLRFAATVRARAAAGSGSWMGTRPRRRRTPSR